MTSRNSEPIPVFCPKCLAGYELTVADRGQSVECACGHQFVVPQATDPGAAAPEEPLANEVMVLCPACASVYKLERAALGEYVECQCGTAFVATEAAVPQQSPASQPEALKETVIRTRCPDCFAEYELEAEVAGERVECACGTQFVVNQSPLEADPAEAIESGTPSPLISVPQETTEASTAISPGTAESEPADADTRDDADPESSQSSSPSRPSGNVYRENLAANTRKKSSAPLMILGGCGIAVVGALLAYEFSGDSSPEPARNTKAAVERPPAAKNSETELTTSKPVPQPAENQRVSLAERLKQARSQEKNQQPTEVTAANPPEGNNATDAKVAVQDRTDLRAGTTDNPNELTGHKDFVIGNPSRGTATSAPPDTARKPGDSTTRTSRAATSRNNDQVTADSAGPANAAQNPATTPSPNAEPKRQLIRFVAPQRQYRRFKDAATAGFKLFASMREKKATANNSSSLADEKAWQEELARTGGLLKTALRLVDDDSDPQRVLQARLILAFCYLEAGHAYEAGILAHAIARWTPADFVIQSQSKEGSKPSDGETKKSAGRHLSAGEALLAAENAAAEEAANDALDATVDPAVPTRPAREAASLALAAFVQAYQATPEKHRGGDFQQIIEVASLFESKFPEHEKLDSIRLYAGDLHQNHGDRIRAADWYARVSRKSSDFARSRLQAGQILWSSYLEARQQAADRETPDENIDRLKRRALDFLHAGVEAGRNNNTLLSHVVVARLTLAQFYLEEERFEQSVAVLTGEPSSVISAVGEGSRDRPAVGIRSLAFTRLAYSTLIKAHLGAKQLDQARSAMTKFSSIAGTDDPAALAQLHLELSSEMTVSYIRLAVEGGEDIDLLATIATSLEQVLTHASSLSPGSLIRAAETANDLAASISIPDDARVIYQQAAELYQAVLDTELSDSGNEKAIRFRLAAALGKAHRFEDSIALYDELLTEQPNIFDAQFAAARTMQAWGKSQNDPKMFVRAITGNVEKPSIWGWARLSLMYQRLREKDDPDGKYQERFLETRLHIAECRLGYARQLTGEKDAERKTAELEKALRELAAIAGTSSSFEAPVWKLLDQTYREIQKTLNRTPEPLFTR